MNAQEAKTANNGNEVSSKIRTSEITIIVNGSADEPCYSIRYYDLSDNEWHVGFSSYCLSYVMDWKNQHFEIVEPVEHVGCTKSTGTSKVKDFWQKVKQKYESKDGQYIDRVLNDIVEETLKDMEGEKEMIEVGELIDKIYDAKVNEVNWEAEYKSLKDEMDVMYKDLDRVQRELECKNRELTELKEKYSDLKQNYDYLDGKNDAYEYVIKYFGKGDLKK